MSRSSGSPSARVHLRAPTRIPHALLQFPTSPTVEPPDLSPFRVLRAGLGGLEIHRVASGNVRYVLSAPDQYHLHVLESTISSAYPGVQFREHLCPLEERILPFDIPRPGLNTVFAARAVLCGDHYFPLRLQVERDAADLLLRHLSHLRGVEAVVQLIFGPVADWGSSHKAFTKKEAVALWINGPTLREREAFERYQARFTEYPHEIAIRVVARGPDDEWENPLYGSLRSWLDQFSERGNLGNSWTWEVPILDKRKPKGIQSNSELLVNAYHHDLDVGKALRPPEFRRYVSSVEVGYLLSLPWKAHHPELDFVPGPSLAPPPPSPTHPGSPSTPSPARLTLGKHGADPVLLPSSCHHVAVLGKTRSGKSSLMQSLAMDVLLHQPEACVVVLDPHGGLIAGVRESLPISLADRTIELDPTRNTFDDPASSHRRVAVPLNPLHVPQDFQGDAPASMQALQVALDDLIQTFKAVWGGEFVGPRVEYFLGMTTRALAEVPGTNLVDAYLVLTDPAARRRLEEKVRDPVLREFLASELPTYQRGAQREALLSTVNKLGRITTNPLLRELVCQRESPVPFSQLLQGRLVLLNLAKGNIGTEATKLLGSVLLTQIWLSLLRTGGPRRPVYLFVDELQNFAFPGLSTLLSEGAKYGLHLVIASQYVEQLPQEVALSLRANADAWVFFQVGPSDSELAWELSQGERVGMTPGQLTQLAPFHGILVAGAQLASFQSFPPPPPTRDAPEAYLRIVSSTRRFAVEETSLDSPFLPSTQHLPTVLEALSAAPLTRKQLEQRVSLDSGELFRTLRSAQRDGFLAWDPVRGTNEITELGRARLRAQHALRPGGTEGEEHSTLLARFALYLKGFHAELRMVPQKAGTPLPDGDYLGAARQYAVEVESSTAGTKPEQVRTNLTKNALKGRCCVFVVRDASRAAQVLASVAPLAPRLQNGRDFLLLHWDGHETFLRYPEGEAHGPFLAGDAPVPARSSPQENLAVPPTAATVPMPPASPRAMETGQVAAPPSGSAPKAAPSSVVPGRGPSQTPEPHPERPALIWGGEGSDLAVLRTAIDKLLAEGRTVVRMDEIRLAIPEQHRVFFPQQKLGKLLKLGGIQVRKVWPKEGGMHRLYILKEPTAPPGPSSESPT